MAALMRMGTMLALGLSLWLAIPPVEASGQKAPSMPSWMARVAPDRYESQRDWTRTKSFLWREYGQKKVIVWQRLESPPGIRAAHLANTLPGATWSGINVYETEGQVHVFVLRPM